MVRIAPVNLPYNPKTLWFDAGELELHAGCDVVVQTARGTEFGHMGEPAFEATPDQVKKLKTPLKPVLRVADDEDRAKQAKLEARAAEALPVFKELAAKASEEMRPVSVEDLFDGDKAVFYFESENRVDFRELVRTLSSRLHVRVDMRQIGVRDEARMVGGLGHCGQELCCKRLGGEFCPVSIRMAKEQDLSLNPQKISGVCGRLMCCLRYEYDAYKDFKSRAPKKNAQVETPDGVAKVVDLDVPREVVSLRIEGEKPVRVPLADFDAPEEGVRPKNSPAMPSAPLQRWLRRSCRARTSLPIAPACVTSRVARRPTASTRPNPVAPAGAAAARASAPSRRPPKRSLRASRAAAAPPRCRAALRRPGRARLRAPIPPRLQTPHPPANRPGRQAAQGRPGQASRHAAEQAPWPGRQGCQAAEPGRQAIRICPAGGQARPRPQGRRRRAARRQARQPRSQAPRASGSKVVGPGSGPPSRPGQPAQTAGRRPGRSGSRSASPCAPPQP